MVEKPEITYDDFYRVDLRVARILWAGKIPGVQRLLRLTLDVGELGHKTVVEALYPTYSPNDLVGKRVVYMANLSPTRVRGIVNHGKLLVAADEQKNSGVPQLVLVSPTKTVPVGTVLR